MDPEQGSVGGAVLIALDHLGLTAQVKPKITWLATGGLVQDAVAKGDSAIALGPYLSDMRNPGLDIVGALPPAAATPVDITGFLSTAATNSQVLSSGVVKMEPLLGSGSFVGRGLDLTYMQFGSSISETCTFKGSRSSSAWLS